jgi:hypothetical protein
MKKIKATEENREMLKNAIEANEGKAFTRCLSTQNIFDSLKAVERHLSISKKGMRGIKIEVDFHARAFPRAYKYSADSTHFRAEHNGICWYITLVYRGTCLRPTNRYKITLTEEAKKLIIANHERF